MVVPVTFGKKTSQAVALKYDRSRSTAPLVVASGQGIIAEKIIAVAREAGIYIKEDPDLLELLAKVPVGEEIPMELYRVVAEILVFVYKVNNRYKEQKDAAAGPISPQHTALSAGTMK